MNAFDLQENGCVRPKGCPFCGGTDSADNAVMEAKVNVTQFRSSILKYAFRVECSCGGSGPSDLDYGNAVAAWNRRHEETPSEFDRLCEVTK